MGAKMDTIFQLREAFGKIIVSYRNKKYPTEDQIDNISDIVSAPRGSAEAIKECYDQAISKESSKATHLSLFLALFNMLDNLWTKHYPSDPQKRNSLQAELVQIITSLYKLNHDSYFRTTPRVVKLSTISYELTTTKTYWNNLTDLGNSIRDFLLVPLGATDVSVSSASKIISQKLDALFANFAMAEKEDERQRAVKQQLERQQRTLQRLMQMVPEHERRDVVDAVESELAITKVITQDKSPSLVKAFGIFGQTSQDELESTSPKSDNGSKNESTGGLDGLQSGCI